MTSTAQRIENLDRAQAVNAARATFKRELRLENVALSKLLRDGIPDWLGTMPAEQLLRCAPRVGPTAAASLLLEARLGPMQEARHITTRQRLLLADELEKIENLKPKSGKRARPHRWRS